jgi:hypothetical protein
MKYSQFFAGKKSEESSGGLAIVAMRQLPRGVVISHTKCHKKTPLRNFEEFLVWNAAEAF